MTGKKIDVTLPFLHARQTGRKTMHADLRARLAKMLRPVTTMHAALLGRRCAPRHDAMTGAGERIEDVAPARAAR
jgi:hypothetical protein